jgi:hypothetical protein
MAEIKVLLGIIELFILFYLYIKVGANQFNLKEHKLNVLILIGIQFLYSSMTPFLPINIRPIITMVYPLAMGIFININLLRNNYIKAVINTLTVAVLLIVSQLIAVLVLQIFVGIDLSNDRMYIYGQMLYLVIMLVITMLLRHHIRRITSQFSDFLELKGLSTVFKIIPYAIFLGILIHLIVQAVYSSDLKSFLMGFWWLAALLIILALFSTVNISRSELRSQKLQNELTLEQEKTHQLEAYQIIMDEVKGFWHNYSNIIQVLIMALESDEFVNPDLKHSIEEYVDTDMSGVRDNIKLTKINNPIIFAAITLAARKAKDLKVELDVVSYGKQVANINSKELSEVVTVLMDNAIQAAYYASKKVNVRIDMSEYIDIKIENDFTTEEGHIQKYGHSNQIGLTTVENIADKYDNMTYSFAMVDNHYTAQIVIK